MKRNDFIIIGVVLAVSGILFAFLYLSDNGGGYVKVETNGKEVCRFSLKEDREYLIETENGNNLLVIKDGKADVTDADCPDKICQKHPPIYRNGESIICLPHKVVISIEKEKGSSVDALA